MATTKVVKRSVNTITNSLVKNNVNSVKLLSNENLGKRLFNTNRTFEQSVKIFTRYYKQKQNIDDKLFIFLRTKIYLRIAEKRSLLLQNN